jgi:exopolysaccharide biosynthesis polyprenyl glycosylphosphotransferase
MRRTFSNQPAFKYALLASDISLIALSFLLAFHLAGAEVTAIETPAPAVLVYYISVAAASLVVCVLSLVYNDLYKRNILLTRSRQATLIIKAMLSSGLVVLVIAAMVLYAGTAAVNRHFIILSFLFATLALLSYRLVLVTPTMKLAARTKRAARRLLIVGADAAGRHVATSLSRDPLSNFTVVGFLDDYKEPGTEIRIGTGPSERWFNLGKLEQLEEIVREQHINEILIAIDNVSYARLIHLTDRCLATGKVVRIYSDFLKVIADKMRIEFYSDIPVIMLSQNPADGLSRRLRIVDVALAGVGLVVLTPLLLLIAAGIKLSSNGPALFVQERIGKGGRPFRFYKFRSMHVGATCGVHQEFVRGLIEGREQVASGIFKITNDPRVFPFGAFIRKTSLDELPQLYNVLKGDMSLVGPRPCLQYEWDCYEDWHKNRLNIVPGCSGIWQALGRSTVSFQEMVILDLYYISNASLRLYIRILLLTLPVIVLGRGAH